MTDTDNDDGNKVTATRAVAKAAAAAATAKQLLWFVLRVVSYIWSQERDRSVLVVLVQEPCSGRRRAEGR